MSKYDRDAIEIYILDHIDTDNYGKQFKYDREYLSFMLNVFKDEYKEHIKRDGIKKAFEDYIMSVPISGIYYVHGKWSSMMMMMMMRYTSCIKRS